MNSIDRELIEASKENNLPEVSRLLSVGADVNTKDHSRTPLHWACDKGHVQVVIELLQHGAVIEAKDNEGYTPLHEACISGHVVVGNELLSCGANIEATSDEGNTPLHVAAMWRDNLAIVKALLAAGADCRAANNSGKRPIHYAIEYAVGEGKSEVSKSLLREFYATTRSLPLHALLDDFTWIGDPNSNSAPPLRFALHRNVFGTDGVVEILEYLVSRNSRLISARDQDGSLPLHVACRRGAPFAIVQSLVDLCKASVKSVTCQGDLPLFLACDIAEPSLGNIFLLMKMYPDLVY
jgi:ankyrin repeat protein